jgi:hypothetical protein
MNLRLTALVLVLGSLLSGCGSSPKGAGSGKYAAVELNGFSRSAVQMATEQVFERNGYKLAVQTDPTGHHSAPTSNSLTFEKPGSTGQSLVWGGLEKGVWEQVVVEITRLGDGDEFLLSAQAFRVKNHGDSLLEESSKMGVAMQSKYQELLEKVRKLLEPLPTSPGVGTSQK